MRFDALLVIGDWIDENLAPSEHRAFDGVERRAVADDHDREWHEAVGEFGDQRVQLPVLLPRGYGMTAFPLTCRHVNGNEEMACREKQTEDGNRDNREARTTGRDEVLHVQREQDD